MVDITKDVLLKNLEKMKYSATVKGSQIRVEVESGNGNLQKVREDTAKIIANTFNGKLKSKKTEIQFRGFSLVVKPAIKQKTGGSQKISFGLLDEYAKKYRYTLNAPSPKEPDESMFINDFNSYIREVGKPITLEINRKIFTNIVGANKVHGTPKADIVLVQLNNVGLKEICFLSHKKEGGAEAFQQYGGLSPSSGAIIYNNKNVQNFLTKVANILKAKKYRGYSGFSVQQIVNDKILIGQSLFGPDWRPGSQNFGLDFVNYVFQGRVKLKHVGNNKHMLLASDHIYPQ